MSVSPGDVVSTSVGVLHVQTVVMERSREDVSFAMSGVDGRGVVHSNMPIGEGMVPLGVDVSDAEALVWFDRERRLRRLGDAVLSPGDGVRALGKLMEGQAVELSLSDCEPVDTVLGYLQEAEGELVEASAWVAEKRMECLRAFEGSHAGWLKYQDGSWSVPVLGKSRTTRAGVEFRRGGVYQFQREGAQDGEYEYFRVVDADYNVGIVIYGGSAEVSDYQALVINTNREGTALRVELGDGRAWIPEDDGRRFWVSVDTVKLLPVGSFEDIDSYLELSEYVDVSLPEALRDIFLDMFSAGEGKPECLPARDELWRGEWTGDYGRCRGRMLEVTSNMLFDIEKSVGYVRWLREQLVGFYRELGFTI